MTNFFALWISSIISSYGASFFNTLDILKFAADKGYKVDLKRMKKVLNLTYANKTLFIPIINFLDSCYQINYCNNCISIELLTKVKLLQEMTNEEKNEYKNNPTKLTALKISKSKHFDLENSSSIELEDGIIYYKFKSFDEILENLNKLDSIIILGSEGKVSELTIKEQKQIVAQKCRYQVEEMFDNRLVELISKLDKQIYKDELECNKTEYESELSERQQKIKHLKQMKEFIPKENEMYDTESLKVKKLKKIYKKK